jgi:16S rRNA (guanine(527)-N(7))-methyltransferase RsmG
MHPARIAELLKPFLTDDRQPMTDDQRPTATDQRLTTNDLSNISTYIDLLLRWNSRINLTAIRDPEQIVTRHFGESLFAARHLFPYDAHVGTSALGCPAEPSSAVPYAPDPLTVGEDGRRAAIQSRASGQERRGTFTSGGGANQQRLGVSERVTVADLGSGAGFPGLPIKLWAPAISLTLIESSHKKAAFLREVTRALTLTDVNIRAVRAESITGSFALVTLRAVERFATILSIAARLVRPGGRLALLIGSAQIEQARSSLPHFSWSDAEPIPLSQSRILAVACRLPK